MSGTSLPLLDVSFDVQLKPSDLDSSGRFPPERFRDRDDRLRVLKGMWQGDLTPFTESREEIALPVNYFRRLSTTLADVLMGSEPEAALDIREQANDGIVDMTRYGAGLLWSGQNADDAPFLSTVAAPAWYPLEGGGHALVMPYRSPEAPTRQDDRAEVVIIRPDGETTTEDRSWSHGMLGSPENREAAGTSNIFIAPRPPKLGSWGTSLYLDLAAPILEIGKRFTSNSAVLDEAGEPLLVWYIGDDDAKRRWPAEESSPTPAQSAEAIQTGLEALRRNPMIQMPPEAVKAEYLEFTGGLEASFEQVKLAKDILNFLTGVPSLLERREMPMSGVALRLTYLPFYRATLALQNQLAATLAQALTYALGSEQAVVWPHVWDIEETMPDDPAPNGDAGGGDVPPQ